MYHVILRLARPKEFKIPRSIRVMSWMMSLTLTVAVITGLILMLIGSIAFSFPLLLTLTLSLIVSFKLVADCAMSDEEFIEESKTFDMYHISKERSKFFDVRDEECKDLKVLIEGDKLKIDSRDAVRYDDPSLRVQDATQIVVTLMKDGTKLSTNSTIWYYHVPSVNYLNQTGIENDLVKFHLTKIEMIDVSSSYQWFGLELRKPEKLICLHYEASASNSAVTMSKLRKRIGDL